MKVDCSEKARWDLASEYGVTKILCQREAYSVAQNCRLLLPTLSAALTINIESHAAGLVPDFSMGGETHNSELIVISFDEAIPGGLESFKKCLKAVIMHEANHAARFAWIAKAKIFERDLLSAAVWEGLATVFERDYAEATPTYGLYKEDNVMQDWLCSLQKAVEHNDDSSEWTGKNPDGPDYMSYKIGTWIVDRCISNTGLSVIELTQISATEIIEHANLTD